MVCGSFSVTAIDPQFYCCSALRFRPSILHKLKLQTHVQPRAVVEAAELWIDQVLLHVAWVEMVRQVEKCDAGATVILLALELNRHPFHNQHVERKQMREAACRISLADEILLLVQS